VDACDIPLRTHSGLSRLDLKFFSLSDGLSGLAVPEPRSRFQTILYGVLFVAGRKNPGVQPGTILKRCIPIWADLREMYRNGIAGHRSFYIKRACLWILEVVSARPRVHRYRSHPLFWCELNHPEKCALPVDWCRKMRGNKPVARMYVRWAWLSI
jgi:hypothetical protein